MMHLKALFQRHSSAPNKGLVIAYLAVSLIGLMDSVYLTTEHYSGGTVTCNIISGCNAVLTSPYSAIFGIPLALLGAIYYAIIFFGAISYLESKAKISWQILAILPIPAWIFSIWLLYLQGAVIKSYCQYCLLSFATSTILFVFAIILWKKIEKQNPQ